MSAAELAIESGSPVRRKLLPYGHQWLDEDDIRVVVEVLRSDWLTTGPKVEAFERAVADFVGAKFAVAVSSGTAALHAAMYAAEIGPGDEVIVPPMTFAATVNAVLFQGGTPVFADVDRRSLLLDPAMVESKVTARTKAIVPVDYAGQPCDYDCLRAIADRHSLTLIADACHSLGATEKGKRVGTLADLNAFSFHPVKHITTGEGGMVTTDDPDLARRMRVFRNHGITTDQRQRAAAGSWFYEMADLGYNYRLTDFQCALGVTQLRKLPGWLARRRAIAQRYDEAFAGLDSVKPLGVRPAVSHSYHLYVIELQTERLKADRTKIFAALRAEGIGVAVHYIPVHLHRYYREHLGFRAGECPVAEAAYPRLLSLPLFPGMRERDVQEVIEAVGKVITYYAV